MELHALDRELAVPQAHHETVLRLGGDLEHVGHRLAGHDQRVVAGGGERVGEPGEDPRPEWRISDVLPCMTCGARTTEPP